MGGNNTADNIGVELMKELVKNLVLLNRNMEVNRDLMLEVRDLLSEEIELRRTHMEIEDNLCGEIGVWGRAFEILDDVMGTKKSPSVSDLVHAYASASEEMSDEEDEPGDEDPEVPKDEPDPVGSGGRRR